MVDDGLLVAETLGADWEEMLLLGFREGQSDAIKCAGDSEADKEQEDEPCLR